MLDQNRSTNTNIRSGRFQFPQLEVLLIRPIDIAARAKGSTPLASCPAESRMNSGTNVLSAGNTHLSSKVIGLSNGRSRMFRDAGYRHFEMSTCPRRCRSAVQNCGNEPAIVPGELRLGNDAEGYTTCNQICE